MNREKLRRAEKVTDQVVEGWNEAQQALRTCWTNGAGILSDPSMARSDLYRAKDGIDKALKAMNAFNDWPRDPGLRLSHGPDLFSGF
jgi:hypothetical protein